MHNNSENMPRARVEGVVRHIREDHLGIGIPERNEIPQPETFLSKALRHGLADIRLFSTSSIPMRFRACTGLALVVLQQL